MDDRDTLAQKVAVERVISRDRLAEELGVSVASLGRLLRKERKLTAREKDIAFRILGLGGSPGVHRAPLLGAIAAGDWKAAAEEPLGYIYCDRGGPETFGLVVQGDSMNLVAPPGAHIAVDPDDRELVSGRHYAVADGVGDATFKRFLSDPARFEPVSSNPSHRAIMLGSDEFKVLGRVVQITFDPD